MPQAAVAAIGIFVTSAIGKLAASFVVKFFLYVAAAYLLDRAAAAIAPRRRSNGLGVGTEVNYYDSGASVRIAYGQVRTGGMETIPPITSGDNREHLHKVLTLVGTEIDSYNDVYFDDKRIPVAAIGPVTFTDSDGQVNSGDFRNFANIRLYRGTATDSLDRILTDARSALYANARGRGIAKAMFRFKYSDTVYKSVPTCTVTYQGKRCYDPRLDLSPGADPTNASYIAWTENPALCLCDYLMSTYGGEYPASDIDWDAVVTAANCCDALVNVLAGTQKRYTCNGVLFATDDFEENVKALVDTMLGRVIFRDGKWRIFAGSWQTPTFTIQKSDWLEGGLSIKFERGRSKRFNEMHCWYVDKNRGWQRMECLPRTNSTYRAADGGETISAETEQLLCTNEYETQRKTEFLLRQSRNQITVAGRLPPRFQDIALWDTGTIVFDHLGWSSKTFRAVGIDVNPDGSLDCVFCEEQSSDWTDLASGDYNTESAALIPEINATTPSAPQGFSATPQINGTILFDWTTPIVKPSGTEFQIIRSTNSANAAVGTVVWQGVANPVPLVMPTSPHFYYVRAIANSAFSAYVPNTFGLVAAARGESESSKYSSLIRDWDFTLSSEPFTYWVTSASNVMSLSPTGGVTGGKMIITAREAFIFAMPIDPLHQLRYTSLRSSMRVRCTSAGAGVNSFGSLQFNVLGWTGVGTPVFASNVSTFGMLNIVGVSALIDSLGLWKEFAFVNTFGTFPTFPTGINPTSYPYFVGMLYTGNTGSSAIGRFELDMWRVLID